MGTKRAPPSIDELVIQPLTPGRLPDLGRLFGQGGDPKWCWCAWYRARSIDFRTATADDNRRLMESATRTTTRDGRAPGLIAYRHGEPIGWVSVGPREDYGRLEHSRVLGRVDDRPVWSIVCFVVARQVRGRGIAAALLAAAVDYAREHGATMVEAYPADTSNVRIPAAAAFKGTLGMFERAGFTVVERRRANRVSAERPIVRRAIPRRRARR